jgi:periodic tryptophan protein 2
MNYKFANLLGAPYRGGNVILHNSELLSPVGNRVSQVGTNLHQPGWSSSADLKC